MTTARTMLALDILIDDTSVEESAAVERGWHLVRWDGTDEALAGADAVVHVTTRVDQAMIDRLESCKVIGRFGTGVDSVDQQAAARAGMSVVRVRDYCTVELTTHTLALGLSLIRFTGASRVGVADQIPPWATFRSVHPLRGDLSAHVIGYGAVGARVTEALGALRIRTIVTTRHCSEQAAAAGAEVVELGAGLAQADLIFFLLDLSDETRGIFGARALEWVKPGAVLVNTARLDLTDEVSLARGIEQGILGGLGLDTRLRPESPLWRVAQRPEVVITPHVGWYSEASLARLRYSAVANSISAFDEMSRGADAPGSVEEV